MEGRTEGQRLLASLSPLHASLFRGRSKVVWWVEGPSLSQGQQDPCFCGPGQGIREARADLDLIVPLVSIVFGSELGPRWVPHQSIAILWLEGAGWATPRPQPGPHPCVRGCHCAPTAPQAVF